MRLEIGDVCRITKQTNGYWFVGCHAKVVGYEVYIEGAIWPYHVEIVGGPHGGKRIGMRVDDGVLASPNQLLREDLIECPSTEWI